MSIHYASTILCPHSTYREKPGYRLMKDSASSLTLAQEAGPNLQKFSVIHSTSHPPPDNLPVKPMGERAAPAPRLSWETGLGVRRGDPALIPTCDLAQVPCCKMWATISHPSLHGWQKTGLLADDLQPIWYTGASFSPKTCRLITSHGHICPRLPWRLFLFPMPRGKQRIRAVRGAAAGARHLHGHCPPASRSM